MDLCPGDEGGAWVGEWIHMHLYPVGHHGERAKVLSGLKRDICCLLTSLPVAQWCLSVSHSARLLGRPASSVAGQ